MKIDRLIAMIMILLEKEVISAGELAKKLEVSSRTIYRDIDTLMLAGLPIFTTQGATGGVGIMKSYKIDKKLFTQKDVQTLASSLGSYRQLYNHEEVVHVQEKLNSIGREVGQSAGESRFAVDLSLNQGNQALRALLSVIESAINEERVMTFDYIDKEGHVTSRTIEPYRVVFKESSWYLQAYCIQKADYRIFKLARMSRLQISTEHFTPRDFSPLAMDGADWMSRERIPVKIRISLSVKDQVIERYGEDNIISVEGDSCVAEFPIVNNEAGYDLLLKFGDKCEVLEPPGVRQAFRSYLRKILAKYDKQEIGF